MAVSGRLIAMVAGVAVIIGGAVLWRSCTESDRDRIVRVIHEGREAVEAGSVRRAMALVSPDYHDNLGLDAERARLMLQRLFLGVQELRVQLTGMSEPGISVLVDGSHATLSFDVVVAGSWQGQPLYLMGNPERATRLSATLIQQDGDWLISGIDGLELPQFE